GCGGFGAGLTTAVDWLPAGEYLVQVGGPGARVLGPSCFCCLAGQPCFLVRFPRTVLSRSLSRGPFPGRLSAGCASGQVCGFSTTRKVSPLLRHSVGGVGLRVPTPVPP